MAGASKADVACLEKKLVLSGINRDDYWPSGKGEHEVTFAIDLASLTVIWHEGPREEADGWKVRAGRESRWLTGTVDWVEPDGRLDDLKTGGWPVSPHGNKQLYSYALPWWVELGRPLVYRRELTITQWPRYPLNGLPEVKTAHVTGLQLMSHLADLRYSLSNPHEANPGIETCRFADCKSQCEAFLASGITFTRS